MDDNIYAYKYIKYKNKYSNNKNNDNLLSLLNQLYNNINKNDIYKQIYDKFIYLPIKNNMQIILTYYPKYKHIEQQTCFIKNMFDNTYIYSIESFEKNNSNVLLSSYIIKKSQINININLSKNQFFIRQCTNNKNELYEMTESDEYANFNSIDKCNINNMNTMPKIKWISKTNNEYLICPTNDPIHKNHILLILNNDMHANYNNRAYLFYYNKTYLLDMILFSKLTNQYIYNSIEIGLNSERMHMHTSNEISPLDNITELTINMKPNILNNYVSYYKINTTTCFKCYYFEFDDEHIDIFSDKFINCLLITRNYILSSDEIISMYFPQVFICPKKNNINRLILTFKCVNKENMKFENQQILKQKYYEQLYGKKIHNYHATESDNHNNMRHNILGYESIIINDNENNRLENIQYIKKLYSNNNNFKSNDNLKNYEDIYYFNDIFENNIKQQYIEQYINAKKLIYDNQNKYYIFNYHKILHNNYNFDEITQIDSIDKYIINTNSSYEFNAYDDKIQFICYDCDIYMIYLYEYIDNNNNTLNIKNIINAYECLYIESSLFMNKIYGLLNVIYKNKNYYCIFLKNILSSYDNFITKKANHIYIKFVLLILLIYQIITMYKKYGFSYINLTKEDIFISNEIYDKKIDLNLLFTINKNIKIYFNDTNNMFLNHYGNMPIILNMTKINTSSNINNLASSIVDVFKIFNFDQHILMLNNKQYDTLIEIINDTIQQIENIGKNMLHLHDVFFNNTQNYYITKIIKCHDNFLKYIHKNNIKINSNSTNETKNKIDYFLDNFNEYNSSINLIDSLYECIIKNKNMFTTILNTDKTKEKYYELITIPKNTIFVSAQHINNIYDINIKDLQENTFNYCNSTPILCTSLLNIDLLFKNNINKMQFNKIRKNISVLTNTNFLTPEYLSRHLLCKTKQDIKLIVIGFDELQKLELYKQIFEVLYNFDIFKKLLVTINAQFNKNYYENLKEIIGSSTLDFIVIFILKILRNNNIIEYDGIIYNCMNIKKLHCMNIKTSIEYVFFDSSYLLLENIIYYDHYDNNIKLFYSLDEWNIFIFDIIEKLKKYRSSECNNMIIDNIISTINNSYYNCSINVNKYRNKFIELLKTPINFNDIYKSYVKILNLLIDNTNVYFNDFSKSDKKFIVYSM